MKIALTAVLALSALLNVLIVGKPREPVTPGTAAVTVALNALLIVGIWIWL